MKDNKGGVLELEEYRKMYEELKTHKEIIANIDTEFFFKFAEAILQALHNSIPKEKTKKKMEDLKKAKERNIKKDFDTVYKDGYYTGGIDAIYELLEE